MFDRVLILVRCIRVWLFQCGYVQWGYIQWGYVQWGYVHWGYVQWVFYLPGREILKRPLSVRLSVCHI